MTTLTLKYPLTLGKTSINKLTFREYTTAGDYLSFDRKGGVSQRIALIASLTGSDESLIQQLRGPDYRAAEKIADAMLENDDKESAGDPEKKPDES